MTAFDSDQPRRKFPLVAFLLLIIVGGIVAAIYYLGPRFESKAPVITVPGGDAVGLAPMEINIADQGAGLKTVAATLSVGGTDHAIVSEQYEQPVTDKKFSIAVAKIAGIKEGPAVLRVTARDASLWSWFRGNQTVVQKNVAIDVTAPLLELIADDRYVNFGGVGAIVYKAGPDTEMSGIKIGRYFFPGVKGQIKSHPDYYLALFAHAYDVAPDARATLVATDKAGNSRQMGLVYELRNVKYKKSTIPVSESFLQSKVVPLVKDVGARQGTPRDIFVVVNKQLRKENEDQIAAITGKSTPSMLWKDAFSQLSNSKVEANFADHRTYVFNKQPIDTSYHLGYDLSVTRHYPVEAANSGNVAFAGDLGIYGNTVILDHGVGLFTLYSHLSSIDVKVGEAITQKQIIGKTGETGLAAGDHLHYGVYLHGVAVLPVEWWDQKWINDNINPKLGGQSSEAVAESQRAERPRKTAQKRRR